MSEIQKFRGRLVERQREARRLDMLIKGSVLALRDELDPFRASEDLNGEMIAELALQLGDLEIQLKSVLAEVAALRRALE
jgi:hypothetical protein